MERTEKIRAVLTGVLVLSMCIGAGCGKAEQKTAQDAESYVIDNVLNRTYMEDGILYYQNDHLYYCDAESGACMMLCGDSSCKHERPSFTNVNPTCPAVLNGALRNSLAIIGDKLYFSFGKEGEEYTSKSFFTASLDGMNRKQFAHIDAQQISLTLYTDTDLYVAYQNMMDTTDPDAIALDMLDQWKVGIMKISLSDGSVEELVEEEAVNAGIMNLKVDGTTLYYVYEEYDSGQPCIHLCSYDLERGTQVDLKDVENAGCCGIFNKEEMSYVIYGEKGDSLWNYNFSSGEEMKIADVDNMDNVHQIGDKFIYSEWSSEYDHKKYYCVDEKGQVDLIKEVKKNASIVVAVVSDKLYMQQYDEDKDDTCIGVMNTQDFLSGDWDKFKVLFWPNATTGSGAENEEE